MTLKSNLETYRRLDEERTAGELAAVSSRKDKADIYAADNLIACLRPFSEGNKVRKDAQFIAASPSILSDLERAVVLIEEMKKQIDSALDNTKNEIRRQFDMEPPQDIDGPVCCATVLLAEEHLMGALTHYKSVMGD